MGHTIQSESGLVNSIAPSNNPSMRASVREFFSKDNEDHPVVEENKKIKEKLKQMNHLKDQSMNSETGSVSYLSQQIAETKEKLGSYKDCVLAEREKLMEKKRRIQEGIDAAREQVENMSVTASSGFGLHSSSMNDPEELRKQMTEISIQLEENREKYKKEIQRQQ